jgi:RimJ/RimL family protein N-acetyltransferase
MSGQIVRSFVFSIITAMKMPETLSTDRLFMRVPRMEDARAILGGWAQDLEVLRYLTWRPHKSIDETESFVRGCLLAWESQARFPYMITLGEDGDVIGMIDPRIQASQMRIGYGLARAHWGKGYMPEATRAVIDWDFQQPSIYRVYATTDVENIASQRVLEKVGMQREGLLRMYIIHPNISDIPRDSYMYAITK